MPLAGGVEARSSELIHDDMANVVFRRKRVEHSGVTRFAALAPPGQGGISKPSKAGKGTVCAAISFASGFRLPW